LTIIWETEALASQPNPLKTRMIVLNPIKTLVRKMAHSVGSRRWRRHQNVRKHA